MLKPTHEIAHDLDAVTAGVFATMMSLKCEPRELCDRSYGDVCARVDFLGALRGYCMVALQSAGAVALVRAMLDVHVEPGDELSEDAVRELCNMIAGGWKSGLGPVLGHAAMSPPHSCRSVMELPELPEVLRQYSFSNNLFQVELRCGEEQA